MIVAGSTVYLAGCIGTDAQGKLIPGTIQDRTRQALDNARKRLEFINLDLTDGWSATRAVLEPEAD
jgi:enamine deaminase RidA (YjgF/YER057c/UK114 family)